MNFKITSKKIDQHRFTTIEYKDFKLISFDHHIRVRDICNKCGIDLCEVHNNIKYWEAIRIVEQTDEKPVIYLSEEVYGDLIGAYYHEFIINKILSLYDIEIMDIYASMIIHLNTLPEHKLYMDVRNRDSEIVNLKKDVENLRNQINGITNGKTSKRKLIHLHRHSKKFHKGTKN
jgi:hypothetical protein